MHGVTPLVGVYARNHLLMLMLTADLAMDRIMLGVTKIVDVIVLLLGLPHPNVIPPAFSAMELVMYGILPNADVSV